MLILYVSTFYIYFIVGYDLSHNEQLFKHTRRAQYEVMRETNGLKSNATYPGPKEREENSTANARRAHTAYRGIIARLVWALAARSWPARRHCHLLRQRA